SIGDQREVDEAEEHHAQLFEPEKDAPKTLRRRNSRSFSLRRLYMARLYSHGATRFFFGGTTGTNPKSSASCRVSSPSYARSISRCTGHDGWPRSRSNLRPSGA